MCKLDLNRIPVKNRVHHLSVASELHSILIAIVCNSLKQLLTLSRLKSMFAERLQILLRRLYHTVKKNLQSLSEHGLEPTECQQLLQAITNNGDQYRVKFRSNTQVMDSIFY